MRSRRTPSTIACNKHSQTQPPKVLVQKCRSIGVKQPSFATFLLRKPEKITRCAFLGQEHRLRPKKKVIFRLTGQFGCPIIPAVFVSYRLFQRQATFDLEFVIVAAMLRRGHFFELGFDFCCSIGAHCRSIVRTFGRCVQWRSGVGNIQTHQGS